jgi:hypothetical protein
MAIAAVLNAKLRGLTDASATIATLDVDFYADGSLRFTDASGTVHRIMPSASLNALLNAVFTGAGGFASTSKRWIGTSNQS